MAYYRPLEMSGFILLLVAISGCAALRSTSIAEAKISVEQLEQPWPLDVKFSHVSLRNVRMMGAVMFISDVINKHPGKIPRFSWGVYVGPPSAYPPPPRNPLVSIDADNVTLRDILESLCMQAGWTYEESLGKLMISFNAPPALNPKE
jgi:hypothetical protein